MARRKGKGKGKSKHRPDRSRRSPAVRAEAEPPPEPPPTGWRDLVARRDRPGWLVALPVVLISGLLWVLAAPAWDLWPLAWLAPAPLVWVIDRAPTPRRARRLAWLSGTLTSLLGFSWVVELLHRYSSLAWPLALLALLLLAAYQGLIFWLFALLCRRIRDFTRARGAPLPMALVAPLCMVTAETVVPTLFPYTLAITQAWQLHVIQIAELTGPVGVTALLFAVGGALHDVAVETAPRRRLIPVAATALLVAAVLIYGHLRIGAVDRQRAAAPVLPVGLVQGNIAFDGPAVARPGYPQRVLHDLQRESADLQARGARLIVWSESSYPFYVARHPLPQVADPSLRRDPLVLEGNPCLEEETDPARSCWRAVPPVFTAPLVFGASSYRVPYDSADYPYNSAFFLVGDRLVARYDKRNLLWFSEHIPLVDTFPWLADVLPRGSGNFARGTELTTFPLEIDETTHRLGPMICLEDTLPGYGRELASLHPDLLVNLTNDTWFGESAEPWQHLALSVFRAVELRTDLVRAVNTGVTAFVDATGRVREHTEVVDPAAHPTPMSGILAQTALLEGGHTVFARIGNLPAYLVIAVTLFLALAWPAFERRRRG